MAAGARNKTMKRGAILFAFNSEKYDYYTMAVAAAKRINHFLDLPVTVVTDEASVQDTDYQFDQVIIMEPDRDNKKGGIEWINKGRHQAYDLSPYAETLLLDVDYIVNSPLLLKTFDLSPDICCHGTIQFFMENIPNEQFNQWGFDTLWATVIMFKKTLKAKQVFECIQMVQENYSFYAQLHNFMPAPFRNDYALTVALRLVNGHFLAKDNIIPWPLMHVGHNTHVSRNENTYTLSRETTIRNKTRKEYILVRDMDIHMMNKDNFVELHK
jgi:hypothetical protein